MKLYEMLEDQARIMQNISPEVMASVRKCAETLNAMPSPPLPIVEMSRELAAKEAVFAAMGGLSHYIAVLHTCAKVLRVVESLNMQG
jgi:hypothetical protein